MITISIIIVAIVIIAFFIYEIKNAPEIDEEEEGENV